TTTWAAKTREGVVLPVAALGFVLLLRRHALPGAASQNSTLLGVAFVGLGLGSTVFAGLVMRHYTGGVLPFDVRYGGTLGTGVGAAWAALARPPVLASLGTLALSGGWLGLLAPLALMPALPSVALNALSASPWMAAGKAHYSVLILPFITIAAAASLRRVRARPRRLHPVCGALVITSAIGYLFEGAGPLGANYAPGFVTEHAIQAEALARSLPAGAAVSASSALVPRVSRRARVYVFPAVLDADYVFVDLLASPAPTSAGDVFLRIQALLADGGWTTQAAADGLLLLHHTADGRPSDIDHVARDVWKSDPPTPFGDIQQTYSDAQPPSSAGDAAPLDASVSLVSATLLRSPDGSVDVDGPRGVLRTIWRAERPLPRGTHLDFWLDLRDHQQQHVWDIAPLWWNPPERWMPGEPVAIDIPDVSIREFLSWQATWTADSE
ncbi:MAG: DUF2079 domain-containing protein, partial [Chloroflexota bacterium]